MSIVIITTKENSKRDFANNLYLATNKGVKLVILVKPKNKNFLHRLKLFYNGTGPVRFLLEMWYAFALRIDWKTRSKLSYFKNYTPKITSYKWIPEVVEISDIHNPEVFNLLEKISPSLIILWDAPIVKKNILQSAKQIINLHMGVCPHYRGAVTNQFAVYKEDFLNIGSTIHYVDNTLDGGNIIEIIRGDVKKLPREMFQELNDKSQEKFLSVALDIFLGKKVTGTPQDITKGENFKLKYWTPSVRYKTAKRIAKWENPML